MYQCVAVLPRVTSVQRSLTNTIDWCRFFALTIYKDKPVSKYCDTMKLSLAAATLPALFVTGYNMGYYGGRFGRPVIITPRGVCAPGGACSPEQTQQFRQQQKEFVDRAFEDLQDEMKKSSSGPARRRPDKEDIRMQQEWIDRAFGLASDVVSGLASSPRDAKEADKALRQQQEWVNRAFGLATGVASGFSSPRFQVKDTDEAFQVELDVPGVKANDIDISVDEDGQVLTVRGERVIGTDDDGAPQTKKFSKSFDLDPTSDTDNITAALNNGVLTVTVPKDLKKVEEKVKKIPVKQVTDEAVQDVPSKQVPNDDGVDEAGGSNNSETTA
jgi:HSP20 family protein